MLANLSCRSISLATVTPSLLTSGAPHGRSMMTFRPRGPRVTFTVLARALRPRATERRADWEKTISFAAIWAAPVWVWGTRAQGRGAGVEKGGSGIITTNRPSREGPLRAAAAPWRQGAGGAGCGVGWGAGAGWGPGTGAAGGGGAAGAGAGRGSRRGRGWPHGRGRRRPAIGPAALGQPTVGDLLAVAEEGLLL